ncbi:MAG: PilZ domain-containing protein [Proteobacteria bacterium]|nr:PilZ domain-containing protein [Pseudomonadota bacterium]
MKKRIEQRKETSIPVEVISTPDNHVRLETTKDLSPQGAYINSTLPTHIGQTLICSIRFPDDNNDYSFFSKVAHLGTVSEQAPSRDSGFGVEFLDISPYQRMRLRDRLRQLHNDANYLASTPADETRLSFWQTLLSKIPVLGK